MKMKKNTTILAICMLAGKLVTAQSSDYEMQVKAYIAKYKNLAVQEQRRTGVPACVKLAQGIYESMAGQSYLAQEGNNHFGIKCKSSWTGPTISHDDDAKGECFRKYTCGEQSFTDHSDFLKSNPRYASLFQLQPTDYVAWANGLKRSGYATNPVYAQKIIKTIEDFNLLQYTLEAADSPGESIPQHDTPVRTAAAPAPKNELYAFNGKGLPEPAKAAPKKEKEDTLDYQALSKKKIFFMNGLRAMVGKKGEVLLEKAMDQGIRYRSLLFFNDLQDEPLPKDMIIYLERKPNRGTKAVHVMAEGESLHDVAQLEGINMASLQRLNKMEPGEEPQAGEELSLQSARAEKPAVTMVATATNKPVTKPSTSISQDVQQAYGNLRNEMKGSEKPAPVVAEAPKATAEPKTSNNIDAANPVVENQDVAMVASTEAPPASVPAAKVETAPVATPVAETKAPTPKTPENELDRLKNMLDAAVYGSGGRDGYEKEQQRKATEATASKPVAPAPVVATTPAPTTTKPVVAAPAPKPVAVTNNAKTHVVKSGETAFRIAKTYNITVDELMKLNGLTTATVQVGQSLKVAR